MPRDNPMTLRQQLPPYGSGLLSLVCLCDYMYSPTAPPPQGGRAPFPEGAAVHHFRGQSLGESRRSNAKSKASKASKERVADPMSPTPTHARSRPPQKHSPARCRGDHAARKSIPPRTGHIPPRNTPANPPRTLATDRRRLVNIPVIYHRTALLTPAEPASNFFWGFFLK